jgi:methanogenic corrinoid protein MtbC1
MVSTPEVALMLQVTETTIKRWADETILPCVKTPGGHRKFLLKDIVQFAERHGLAVGGSTPPALTKKQLEQLELGVHTRDFFRIAKVFREEVLQADRDGILKLLLYVYKHRISFPIIMDEVVRPAFDFIGAEWEKGTLCVTSEHAASQSTTESLIRMASELHRKGPNGLSALCACPEHELHETGLRGLAYTLECEGWVVHFIGANTPIDNLIRFHRVLRPDLVCLSTTTGGKHRTVFLQRINRLADQVHSSGGKMIIGGLFADRLHQRDVQCDHVAESIQDAVSFSRQTFGLKPGPKKRSQQVNSLYSSPHTTNNKGKTQ